MFQGTLYHNSAGSANTTELGWTWFRRHRISQSFSINQVKSDGRMKEAFMAIPSLWDFRSVECFCTVYRSAVCRRESRSLYSFVFLSSDVSQQITSWALLVNRPCMFRHEENLCLFVIHFCHVSTQCFIACWHVSHDHIIHLYMRTPHGSRLAAIPACTKSVCRSPPDSGV